MGRGARLTFTALPATALVKLLVFPHSLTLAWDIDGTLITHEAADAPHPACEHSWASSSSRGRVYSFWRRPYAQHVLKVLSWANEQHIFTAATRPYADSIVDSLYPGFFAGRLYRDALSSGVCGKDLTRLGTPLSRTLLIDDQARNRVGSQLFLLVPKYERQAGAPDDTVLLAVAAIVLAHNLVGPAAFDAVRWLNAAPSSPRML